MGNVRLYGATSGYTELAPPAVAPDGVLTLPSGTGTIATTTDQGLVHINTTTFSAVSSVSLNNVFTSTYENYRLLMNATGTNSGGISARMRVGGVDNTANSYNRQNIIAAGGSIFGGSALSNLGEIGQIKTNQSTYVMEFQRPAIIDNTFMQQLGTDGQVQISWYVFAHSVAAAFDGLSIFPNAGTMTGTIRVYGYKNS